MTSENGPPPDAFAKAADFVEVSDAALRQVSSTLRARATLLLMHDYTAVRSISARLRADALLGVED